MLHPGGLEEPRGFEPEQPPAHHDGLPRARGDVAADGIRVAVFADGEHSVQIDVFDGRLEAVRARAEHELVVGN